MKSTRLPGKVLLPLGETCVLRCVLGRLVRADLPATVVVATSDQEADDQLADACEGWGFDVFRGSETDVLGRFAAAADRFAADRIIRVNSDNPFIDPGYIKPLADALAEGVDYVSYRRSDGRPVMLTALSFFVEILSRECLERANREITDAREREHVTIGIYGRPERYAVRWLDVPGFCNDDRLRLTIDTQADLEMARAVWAALGERATSAGAEEIVRLILSRADWLEAMSAANSANPKVVKS
jgi:spore coat polysaccharide biosynthesis protein SpsF